MFRIAIATVVLTTVAACNAQDSSETLATVDQSGADISVLQAWISSDTTAMYDEQGIVTSTYPMKPHRCATVERIPSSGSSDPADRVLSDCSKALEEAAVLYPGLPQTSPLINKALFSYFERPNGDLLEISGRCEMVEFRTVIRDSALNAPSFKGIGFHMARTEGVREYIEKNRLHAVGQVTLADGSAATVHRFIAQGRCFGTGGNGGSIYSRSYQFKPFAMFRDGEAADSYRVWDQVPTDYHLGRKSDNSWVNSFDRQSELLRQ